MDIIYHTSQSKPDKAVVDATAEILLEDGVAVIPTDSVYGIACAVKDDSQGYSRIFDIKRRPSSMKLPWLIADKEQLFEFSESVPEWAVHLADKLWPGALTLIVKASSKVPGEFKAADGTIALRMPDSNFVRELIREIGCPLAATSANVHGKPSAISGDDLDCNLTSQVDIVVNAGDAPVAIESTIVDCTKETPTIVRHGALSAPTIEVICSERSN